MTASPESIDQPVAGEDEITPQEIQFSQIQMEETIELSPGSWTIEAVFVPPTFYDETNPTAHSEDTIAVSPEETPVDGSIGKDWEVAYMRIIKASDDSTSAEFDQKQPKEFTDKQKHWRKIFELDVPDKASISDDDFARLPWWRRKDIEIRGRDLGGVKERLERAGALTGIFATAEATDILLSLPIIDNMITRLDPTGKTKRKKKIDGWLGGAVKGGKEYAEELAMQYITDNRIGQWTGEDAYQYTSWFSKFGGLLGAGIKVPLHEKRKETPWANYIQQLQWKDILNGPAIESASRFIRNIPLAGAVYECVERPSNEAVSGFFKKHKNLEKAVNKVSSGAVKGAVGK